MSTTASPTWRYADSYEFMSRTKAGLPPVIICCACNGGIQGRESNPAIPETADEIADSVYDAYVAGASIVHVHARNPDQLWRPETTAEGWWKVNAKIRERCPDIIINNTTGGGPDMTNEERLSCLDGGPEMASLNTSPDMSRFRLKERKAPLPHPHDAIEYDECLPQSYGYINALAVAMKTRNIKPEIEVYHPGGLHTVNDLIANGHLSKPYWIQTVMGSMTASYPTPENVINMLREFPPEALWLTSGIGPFQLPITTLAILMGGHVRVGLEDNIYFARGRLAASNAELVSRAARLSHELNREVATPSQAREMLGMSLVPSRY